MIKLKIPGSASNLGAGFDALGLALRIHLNVEARPSESVKIELAGEGADSLPRNDKNLLIRSYRKACETFDLSPQTWSLKVHNEIPLARGLGSSGAAITAGLMLAQAQSKHKLSLQKLLEIGAEIEGHPENVAASLLGGFVVCCPTEKQLFSQSVTLKKSLQAVVVVPDFEVSTAEARKLLPEKVSFEDAVRNIQRATLMVAAMSNGEYDFLKTAAEDQLHQPYRKKLIPGFDSLLEAMYRAGANAVFLSGSGSTVCAFSAGQPAKIAEAAEKVILEQSYLAKIKIVDVASNGAEVWNEKE